MLFNIYRMDGNLPLGITDWEHLRVMRLDYTERQLYNHRFIEDNPENLKQRFKHEREKNAPLKKIAFIARDFHEGRPSGQLSEEFFIALKNYAKYFDIYFYSLSRHPVSNRFASYATVRRSPNCVALGVQIYLDKIDILIDMQGYMVDNFKDLLLRKPAPVQIHWLGYPGTLGLSTMDYLIADETIVPESSQKYYREKIAYLPNCYQSNNPKFIQNEKFVMREYFQIPKDAFVFTHFNSDYKLDRRTWFVWMEIIQSVKNAYLVFTVLTSGENDMFIKQLVSDANLFGVGDRVKYLPKETRFRHFNRLQVFDCGLDTYRVNGHTTNADLVCAGLPFITYTSDTYHNRVGKSILKSLDLEELVCYSFDEYKKKAIEVATNKEYYAGLKKKVIENREKTLYNPQLYTRNFVDLLYSIWNQYHEDGKTELEHFYGEEGWKNQPIQQMKLSDFNNNYRGTKKMEWKFYGDQKIVGNVYEKSELRKQYLKDYANVQDKCVAFSMDGKLYDEMKMLVRDKNNIGVWVLEEITEKEPDVNETLNKDYKLPKICLYYKLKKEAPKEKLSQVVSYLYNQMYLNAELVVIADNLALPPDGLKFIYDHNNYVYYHNNNEGENDNEIINYYTSTKIRIEIADQVLNNLRFVQNVYEQKILPNIKD